MHLNDGTRIQFPIRYLVTVMGFFISALSAAVYIGASIQNIDSRLIAGERRIDDVDKELAFRVQIRTQIMNKLDSIEHRLSLIEGKLDDVHHEMRR
jgi:hypothetical protein